MIVACTGPHGRVGRLLVQQGVVPLSCDVTQPRKIVDEIDSVSPDVVIHLAGISDVDYCEMESHWAEVVRVNFNGTLNLLRVCADRKIPVAYVSSEQVFPGRPWHRWSPYREGESVARVGVNNYALTKIACEGLRHTFTNMKVVRTSYLFDYLRLRKQLPLSDLHCMFPTFIHRSYTYLPYFVHNLLDYAHRIDTMPGVLHLAGSKTVSQFQFMRDFVRCFHVPIQVRKRTHEWPAGNTDVVVAARPHRVGLSVQLAHSLGFPSSSYLDGFKEMAAGHV